MEIKEEIKCYEENLKVHEEAEKEKLKKCKKYYHKKQKIINIIIYYFPFLIV